MAAPPSFASLTHLFIRTFSQSSATNLQDMGPRDAPSLQILSVRNAKGESVNGGPVPRSPNDRFRLVISDGIHFAQAMLATAMNELVYSGAIYKCGLVHVKSILANEVQDKRVIILRDVSATNQGDLPRFGSPMQDLTKMPEGLPMGFDEATAVARCHDIIERYQAAFGMAPAPPPPQEPQPVQNHGSYGMGGGMGGGMHQQSGYGQPSESMYGSGQSMGSSSMAPRNGPPGPSVGVGAPAVVFPIRALTPYQNKWTIKATVLQKSEVRTFTNKNGEGKLFSVTLADESGEIRATGFGDVVTQFYDLLVENHVFYVSQASIKVARKQYAGAVQNEYEMTLESKTQIIPCSGSIATAIRYERVPLSHLMDKEKDATIDVLGVVKEIQDATTLVSKTTNRPLVKRDIIMVDDSRFAVRATLWGRQAETFVPDPADPNPILLLKGVRVGDYGGRCLSCIGGTSMIINPDVPDAHRLRGWYDNAHDGPSAPGFELSSYSQNGVIQGSSGAVGSILANGAGSGPKTYKTFVQVDNENLGNGEKADYFTVRGATVCVIREKSLSYPACQSADCQKKVFLSDNGWRCEKCSKYFPTPQYRYISSMLFCDFTGQQWVSFFNETAEVIFGKTANELNAMYEENEDTFKEFLRSCFFKQYNLRIRAKVDTYNSESRVRLTCVSVEPIQYGPGAHELADLIKAYGV
ncbi:hypothetical protein DFJ73DRAFT_828424 [Zopfochytrium polystomum]|nr:hypothetical protein DFJ73DRAFT_828424 [Zopfochytrium polystomum]